MKWKKWKPCVALVICWAVCDLGLTQIAISSADESQSTALTLKELRKERRRLADRPRRLIMNNDGCDALYFPRDEPVTAAAFLAKRTLPLAGTHVDTISYCSISSGFSYFTHATQVGTILRKSGADSGLQPDMRNVAQDLIDGGADCLQAVVSFCRQQDIEVFWSMRMNDTHDAAHRPDKPYFLFPPLKSEHPEWLVGNAVDRTPFGRWSSVDYSVPDIRAMAIRFLTEVCERYDIDGIELDFFRHLCYFRSTAEGGNASDTERAVMTDLLRQVRTMTERRGLQRGKPILVAVRVPDSVEYARDLGLDVTQWLQEGLVDMLVTTCYFRLNPWETSVELGHRYGVKVYPCLSDSRVRGESRFRRSSLESYRGRAMNAWRAGADGIHVFNHFDPHAAIWRELGDPELLATRTKLYFVHVRDGDPATYLKGGDAYRSVELLGPGRTRSVTAARPLTVRVCVGDDIQALQAAGRKVQASVHLEMTWPDSSHSMRVFVNGSELSEPAVHEGWLDYAVPVQALRCGVNELTVRMDDSIPGEPAWNITFESSRSDHPGWVNDAGSDRTYTQLTDQGLVIADRGDRSGDYLYYRHPWTLDPDGKAVVEAEVRVKSGDNFLIVTNGEGGERLRLSPGGVSLHHHPGQKCTLDTTDRFHLYRIEIQGRDLSVYIDGERKIAAPGVLVSRDGYARNEISFGAANSPMQGEAVWKRVRAQAAGVVCRDLALRVAVETSQQ